MFVSLGVVLPSGASRGGLGIGSPYAADGTAGAMGRLGPI